MLGLATEMYPLKFVVLFHLSAVVTTNEFTTEIKLIKDLVQIENGYFVIQSFLCWDEGKHSILFLFF